MKKKLDVAVAVSKNYSIPWANIKIKGLIETALLASLAMILPALLAHTPNNQWITGILINSILFLACWRVGIMNSLLIGILPSSIALFRGLLPAPMAIMIPYIVLGNAILITSFGFLKMKSLTLRVLIASFLKFLIIFGAVSLLVEIPKIIIQMMQWPQLITALAGGMLAIRIIKTASLKKNTNQ